MCSSLVAGARILSITWSEIRPAGHPDPQTLGFEDTDTIDFNRGPAAPTPDERKQRRRDHANVDFGADGKTTMLERGSITEDRVRSRLGAAIDRAVRDRLGLSDRLDAGAGKVRRGLLAIMTPRMIKESYGDVFENGSLTRYVDKAIERGEEKHRRAQEAAEIMQPWHALPATERKALAELMHDATLAGVRPNAEMSKTALRDQAMKLKKKADGIRAGMADRSDGGTQRQHDAVKRLDGLVIRLAGLYKRADSNHAKLKARYDAMSKDAREVYDTAEDALKQQFDAEKASQIGRIERLKTLNAETGRYEAADAKIISELKVRLSQAHDEAAGGEPYFPLKRFGDFVVRVNPHQDFDLGFEPVEFYESEVDAATRVRQLEVQGYSAYQTTRSSFFQREFNGAAPEFIREALEMVDGSALSDEDKGAIRDQFQQLYLKTLPDASALKSRIHRHGVPGFHQDAARSFAFTMLHGGNRIANLNHVDQLQQAIEDMKVEAEQKAKTSPFKTNTLRQQLIDEMQMHLRDLMAPPHNALAFGMQQLGFLWMLGGNVSTAAVNLTQTLQFTVPGLLSQFSTGSALKVFGQMAAGVATPTRLRLNVGGRWVSADAPAGLSQIEVKAYEELARRGVISVTMAYDLAGVAERGIESTFSDSGWGKTKKVVMAVAAYPQHTTERINREVAAMSFYRLARQAGKSHEAAIDGAAEFAHQTQFDYSAANRARAMRQPWVRVITLFKTYTSNLIYRQWRDLRTALGLNAATPDERSMAARAFALRTAMVGMTTGTMGVMGVSTVLGILEALKDLFDDDDEPADLEHEIEKALADLVGEGVGEALTHGLLPRSWAERTSMSGLLLRDQDRDARDPQGAMLRVYESAFGPVGSILSRGLAGYEDMRDGDAIRGLGAALPNVAGGMFKAGRFASEGMLERDGTPILDDVTPGEIAAQALGFAPSRGIEHWEDVNRQKNAELMLQQRSSRLRNRLVRGLMAGDAAAQEAAIADIQTWNAKHPAYPIGQLDIMAAISRLANKRRAVEEGRFVSKKAFAEIQREEAQEVE